VPSTSGKNPDPAGHDGCVAVTPSPDARQRRFERVFAEAYGPVQRYVLRRADRSVADDVVAETFTTVWRRLDDVPEEAVVPWCYGIARRTLANSRRGDRRRDAVVQRLAGEREPTPVERVDLDESLAMLDTDQRELLRLWAWEELAPREIAVVLGVSANAVSIRLHRARAALREQLLMRKNDSVDGHDEAEPRRTAASTEEGG
jgi:RNA polymerase sigma-70 factor, ECF subfamily